MNLPGLHHITAVASNPRGNLAYYTGVLGLRLVKLTVNFDDPSAYHFYFADAHGTPGSALTFFHWGGARRGRTGHGQTSAIAFAVGADSLPFWAERLKTLGATVAAPVERFGERVLAFTDPDGLPLELVATAAPAAVYFPPKHDEIPAAHRLRGFHSVTLALDRGDATRELLTATMGWSVTATAEGRTRLASSAGAAGGFVDLLVDRALPRGVPGAGTVHHIAFRTPDDAAQLNARRELITARMHASPVMERFYFRSIYWREPEGILFEIATDQPGFTADEPVESLGTKLCLPPPLEPHRAEIEAALPPLS